VSAPYYALGGTGYKSRPDPGYVRNGASLPPKACAASGYYWNDAWGGAYCTICSVGYACPSSQLTS